MTAPEHIENAYKRFDAGAVAYFAAKPPTVSLHRWMRRLYNAAHRRGRLVRVLNAQDGKTVIIKPQK